MLLNTMTDNEIFKEVKTDFESYKRKRCYLLADFGKFCKKSRVFPYTKYYEWKSPNNNILLITFTALKRGDWDSPYEKLHAQIINNNGSCKMVAINQSGERVENLVVYSSHFFSRYRERFFNDNNISATELFRHFINRNGSIYSGNDKKNNKTYVIMQDGIGLGEVGAFVTYVNTFITYDMLHSSQSEYIAPIHEFLTNHFNFVDFWHGNCIT